ncbi:MAG TPA: glycosyltransferase [Blastocatellia bacterium]|nr:glycosyltransferase [Blastocatellia bacterium]
MNAPSPNAAVVVPTFNEGEVIHAVARRVLENQIVSWLIVVDDSSTDDTIEVVKALERQEPRVRLLVRRGKKRSFAKSYVEGFRYALDLGADTLIQMDGDGSHDAGDIPRIIDALRTTDVVVCSRYTAGGRNEMTSTLRHFLSYMGSRFSEAALRVPVRDMTGGFNGWNADVIRKMRFEENRLEGFGFQVWLKSKAYATGAKLTELPIVFKERECGRSKFRFSMALEVLLEVIKMRSKTSRWRPTDVRT